MEQQVLGGAAGRVWRKLDSLIHLKQSMALYSSSRHRPGEDLIPGVPTNKMPAAVPWLPKTFRFAPGTVATWKKLLSSRNRIILSCLNWTHETTTAATMAGRSGPNNPLDHKSKFTNLRPADPAIRTGKSPWGQSFLSQPRQRPSNFGHQLLCQSGK